MPVSEEWYARPTLDVARDLVGAVLETHDTTSRIVEVEAYTDDAASHFVTRPRAAAIMGSTFGRIYVYRIYGMHRCLNVTTDRDGPGAVLFRALEPLDGLDAMRRRRGTDDVRALADGPAKLCAALGIGDDAFGRPAPDVLRITPSAAPPRIRAATRIGVTRARTLRWRFVLEGSPWISRPVDSPRRPR